MFDTHCHLNFKAFALTLDATIADAKNAGVATIVVPGTDLETSQKAVEIANRFDSVYAAVGIHPHHAREFRIQNVEFKIIREKIEEMLLNKKVVAIGEVGLDRHVNEKTKYEDYHVDEDFIKAQTELLTLQIQLAIKYHKSLILHNRETADELIAVLTNVWDTRLEHRTVLHCCEPDEKLLTFAKAHHIFIGVDGDVTYIPEKQEFIKTVPLDMLVVETDAPYLLPEPLRSQKKFPNTPANIPVIINFVAKLLGKSAEEVRNHTTQNAKQLFHLE